MRLFVQVVLDVSNIHRFREKEEESEEKDTERNGSESKVVAPGKVFGDISTDDGAHCCACEETEVPDCHSCATLVDEEDIYHQLLHRGNLDSELGGMDKEGKGDVTSNHGGDEGFDGRDTHSLEYTSSEVRSP